MPDLERAVSALGGAITAEEAMPDLDTPWEWHRELTEDSAP